MWQLLSKVREESMVMHCTDASNAFNRMESSWAAGAKVTHPEMLAGVEITLSLFVQF